MPEQLPPNAQKWMAQWRSAAVELPKIRDRELRSMTDMQIIENGIDRDLIFEELTPLAELKEEPEILTRLNDLFESTSRV